MPLLHEVARLPFPADPDLDELREQAARRRVAVRVKTSEKFKADGHPIELYAKRNGNPMLRAFQTAGAALEWITAGADGEAA